MCEVSSTPPPKLRLDILLVDRFLARSRSQARCLVLEGAVRVEGLLVRRPGQMVNQSAQIELEVEPRFVGRGGDKAAAALERWPRVPALCADVGASTGGFTDALLQAGAERVYAIDVGHDQLDPRLRADSRVVIMEKTNARYLKQLPELVGLVFIDLSFISVRLVLPAVAGWLAPEAEVLVLLKPQFEGRRRTKRGVIRDAGEREQVLEEFQAWCPPAGW